MAECLENITVEVSCGKFCNEMQTFKQVMNPQPNDQTTCQELSVTYDEIRPDITNLTVDEGKVILASTLLLWGVAYTIRVLVRMINESDA